MISKKSCQLILCIHNFANLNCAYKIISLNAKAIMASTQFCKFINSFQSDVKSDQTETTKDCAENYLIEIDINLIGEITVVVIVVII